MAGGGVHGKAVGIDHSTTTVVGAISAVSRAFIMMWTRDGEGTTETVIGTDIAGTMNGFPISGFSRTGRGGMIIATGKIKEPGASRAITRDRNNRGRSWDSKGNSTFNSSRMFGAGSNDFNKNNSDSKTGSDKNISRGSKNSRENRSGRDRNTSRGNGSSRDKRTCKHS
jgi:hypothetical protein